MNLDELFDMAEKSAITSFKQNGEVLNILYVHAKIDNKKTVIAFPNWKVEDPDTEDRNKATIEKLVQLCYLTKTLEGVVLMSEAWMATVNKGCASEYVQPRNNPERKEILLVAAYNKNGDSKTRSYEIKRKNGNTSLEPPMEMPGASCWIDRAFGKRFNPYG